MAFNLNNIPKNSPTKDYTFTLESYLKKEISLFGNSLSSKKKYNFYNELAVLLKANITLKDALSLITKNQVKENDKLIFDGILEKILSGKSLSTAIKESKHFTNYEYHSIHIGEETGTLSLICNRLGQFFERKNEQKRIVISALTYPAIVLSTAILVVVFMLSYVVPMFKGIFEQNKLELPYLTKLIVSFSEAIQNYGWYFFFLGIAIFFGLKFLIKNHKFRELYHNAILRTPILGKFILKIYLAQFTQAMSLLTSSKVPILNSIQLVKNMIDFIPLQNALQKVEESILKGKSLSESLTGNIIFNDRIISLVKVAEETNQTEYIFNQLNEQYNNEVVQQSKLVATVIEPFIVLIVGLIVGLLLIALYLPMFKLSSVIG